LLLANILDLPAKRKNSTGANKERDGINRDIGANGLAAMKAFVRRVVAPLTARGR